MKVTRLAGAMALSFASVTASTAFASNYQLEFLGEKIIASGASFGGTTIGGLSGIDYNKSTGQYYVISDDRSPNARFYTLDINLGATGFNTINFSSATTIKDINGQPFAQNSLDPEAIRVDPVNNTLFWTSERDQNGDPWIREMGLDGLHKNELLTPAKFKRTTATDIGASTNRAFESLTFSNDGNTIYTATEQALIQDDTLSDINKGSNARILVQDVPRGDVTPQVISTREYVYPVGPVAKGDGAGFEDNGLVELLNLGNGNLLAVEREFVSGVGNTIKVFEVDMSAADNVAEKQALDGTETAVSKELILDFDELDLLGNRELTFAYLDNALDNIEGVTYGPEIDGYQTLIFVSDDNFNAFDDGIDGNGDDQFTQFLAFKLKPVPVPAALPLFLSALTLLAVARRKTA